MLDHALGYALLVLALFHHQVVTRPQLAAVALGVTSQKAVEAAIVSAMFAGQRPF
jgi:hypothetical protein